MSDAITRYPFFLKATATLPVPLKHRGKKVELTQVEYLIMKTFLENPGKALSRDNILSIVWGKNYQGDIKVVDVNIRRLRLKIEEDAAQPKHITTVWGYGYKWEG